MTDQMRIGLIGLGKAGLRHAAAVRKSGEARVVAVADPAPAAASAAGELGLPCVPGYEAMLEQYELDAVIVSLPHALLSRAALTAARHGLHILLEKPMGITVGEAREVIQACRRADVRLMVNFVHRFRSEYRQALAALRSGAIGRPVLILDAMASGRGELPPWVWRRELSGGGMMMYNGVHSVDRLAWLADSSITEVTAAMTTCCHPVQLEDNLVGTLTFANGALGAVIQHKSDAAVTLTGWETTVYGTRGALRVITGNRLEVISDKERLTLQTEADDRFLGAFREFVEAIRTGRDPSPSGEDGVRALQAVLALYEAAQRSRPVAVGKEEEHADPSG